MKSIKMTISILSILICTIFFHNSLSHVLPETMKSTKSDTCPYGNHYIDSCLNMCTCHPEYGNAGCLKTEECSKQGRGDCPLGETYTDPMWGPNFKCLCNQDQSQTYECFDLRQHKTQLREILFE